MSKDVMTIEERAAMWQEWAAYSHVMAVSELHSGDLETAIWWQNCGAMDHEAMWLLLARVLGVPVHCAVVQ